MEISNNTKDLKKVVKTMRIIWCFTIVIAIVLMFFVKHGDSKQLTKGRKLTKEEKKQIRLDALDAD